MLSHWEGFENERMLIDIYRAASKKFQFPFVQMMAVVKSVAPDTAKGAFKRRPCVRVLRYIGHAGSNTDPLSIGNEYESETFNGATYGIKGLSVFIGCNDFVWVSQEGKRQSPSNPI